MTLAPPLPSAAEQRGACRPSSFSPPFPILVCEHGKAASTRNENPACAVVRCWPPVGQGEAFGVALDRIDFIDGMLMVDQQVVIVDRRPTLAVPRTRASIRDVPLPELLSDALARHIEKYAPEDVLFRTGRDNLIRRDYFNARVDLCPSAVFEAHCPSGGNREIV